MLSRIRRLERLLPAHRPGQTLADWRALNAAFDAATADICDRMGDDLYSADFEQAAADYMAICDELMPGVSRALRLAYGDNCPPGRAGDVVAVREFALYASGAYQPADE